MYRSGKDYDTMQFDHEQLTEKIRKLVEPVIDSLGIEIVDIEIVGGRGRHILRILVEKPGRITIDDCVQVNREVADLLDIEDPIPSRYTLEVSSPGLDRPFKTIRDYERAYGQLVKIITSNMVDGTNVHIGRLERCEDGVVIIASMDKQINIPLEFIQKAQRELVWE